MSLGVQSSAELETYVISVERINEYSTAPQEVSVCNTWSPYNICLNTSYPWKTLRCKDKLGLGVMYLSFYCE